MRYNIGPPNSQPMSDSVTETWAMQFWTCLTMAFFVIGMLRAHWEYANQWRSGRRFVYWGLATIGVVLAGTAQLVGMGMQADTTSFGTLGFALTGIGLFLHLREQTAPNRKSQGS